MPLIFELFELKVFSVSKSIGLFMIFFTSIFYHQLASLYLTQFQLVWTWDKFSWACGFDLQDKMEWNWTRWILKMPAYSGRSIRLCWLCTGWFIFISLGLIGSRWLSLIFIFSIGSNRIQLVPILFSGISWSSKNREMPNLLNFKILNFKLWNSDEDNFLIAIKATCQTRHYQVWVVRRQTDFTWWILSKTKFTLWSSRNIMKFLL